MRLLPLVAAAASVLLLSACRSAGPCGAPCRPDPCATAAAPPTAPTASGALLDHRDGSPVAFGAMADRLATASHVYVGELHDQALHHAFQAKVLRALADRWQGKPVALGLEMFFRPFQPALDAYVRGEIDEKEMLARTEWDKRWGFGWEMYAPMLRLCRERKIPVIALNAEKEVTRTVSRSGLEGLTPEQRASLPPLDTADPAHRAFVKKAFGAHGAAMPADKFERFYLSMVIWDEVMSSSVATWLAANGPDAHMVVVAGDGHIADRFGVAGRAAKKSGRPYLSVVQYNVDAGAPDATAGGAGEEAKGPGEAEGDEADPRLTLGHADYSAWWAPSGPPPKPKPAAPAKPAPPTAPAAPGTPTPKS